MEDFLGVICVYFVICWTYIQILLKIILLLFDFFCVWGLRSKGGEGGLSVGHGSFSTIAAHLLFFLLIFLLLSSDGVVLKSTLDVDFLEFQRFLFLDSRMGILFV